MKRSLPLLTFAGLSLFTHAHAMRPNIIFFIADDMLPNHFNCLQQGKDKYLTPNIDRLAREGTLMLQQHVVSPVCTPSRYNVLTGNFGSRAQNHYFTQNTKKNGQSIVEFNTHILSTDRTLPALLKAAGYKTGMAGKDHVVQVNGLKSFKNFKGSAHDPTNKAQLKANHELTRQAMLEIGFNFADSLYHNNPSFLGLYEVAVQNMDWITDAGVRFIKQPHTDPFFLYFATTVPHGPTQA
ncbi:MAG: sulfatase-like hydrolase/transferase, partial [Verrucomicrobiota bacterium]|nr:sulfatase-like hydrolase/transferase [Verrucomicrobiota bacterium]